MAQTAQGNSQIRGFHLTPDQAREMAERGINPMSADALIRRPKPKDEILELSDDDLKDCVTVVCFVDSMPWTHERPLAQGEQVSVPRKVAQVMADRHQVTIVSEDQKK